VSGEGSRCERTSVLGGLLFGGSLAVATCKRRGSTVKAVNVELRFANIIAAVQRGIMTPDMPSAIMPV
jgi:hypothetical protein